MGIDEYFGDWIKVIDKRAIMLALSKIDKNKIEPAFSDIFKAFTLCSLNNLKIVFIGQDPYPQKGVATGILFGNKKGTTTLSPSLQIIKEACIDYSIPHGRIKFDETLESWGKQGILLLNSALTVEVGKPNSHSMIWRPFISKLLDNLKLYTGIVYVLFGTQAQTFKPYIDSKFNNIIEENHPAYYARINKPMPPSLFKDINKLMIDKYNESIKWYYEE